jgi:hypothetical protein
MRFLRAHNQTPHILIAGSSWDTVARNVVFTPAHVLIARCACFILRLCGSTVGMYPSQTPALRAVVGETSIVEVVHRSITAKDGSWRV